MVLVRVVRAYGQNSVFCYFTPHLLEDFGISRSRLSFIFMVGTVLSSLLQPFFGRCVDRCGARWPLVLGVSCFAGTLLLLSLTQTPNLLILDFVLLRGLSIGALEVWTNAAVNRWFSSLLGTALATLADV